MCVCEREPPIVFCVCDYVCAIVCARECVCERENDFCFVCDVLQFYLSLALSLAHASVCV